MSSRMTIQEFKRKLLDYAEDYEEYVKEWREDTGINQDSVNSFEEHMFSWGNWVKGGAQPFSPVSAKHQDEAQEPTEV